MLRNQPRRGGTIFDNLRIETMRDGATKSPAMQDELEVWHSQGGLGTMDSSGIGQAWTTSRSSRTYAGGGLQPMIFFPTPGGPNNEIALETAAVQMNARSAYPGRGLEPTSPLMRRR